ncbi:Tyrosine-protein kinase JAK2, partial [Fragariocoptes setiger]
MASYYMPFRLGHKAKTTDRKLKDKHKDKNATENKIKNGCRDMQSVDNNNVYNVKINFLSPKDYNFHEEQYTFEGEKLAEDLCHDLTSSKGMGTICSHAFALKFTNSSIWLAPNQSLYNLARDTDNRTVKLELRMRFLPSSFETISLTDPAAFEYMFAQIRHDWLHSVPPKMNKKSASQELIDFVLGLACIDIARHAIEIKVVPDRAFVDKVDLGAFLPSAISRLELYWIRYNPSVHKTTLEAYNNCKQDLRLIKYSYMKLFVTHLLSFYGHEYYDTRCSVDGAAGSVQVQIRMTYKNSKCGIYYKSQRYQRKDEKNGLPSDFILICNISEVCYVSINGNTATLCRTNGISPNFEFQDELSLKSFVSFIDGYYRLMVKWSFNICKEIMSPTLVRLKELQSHGPIGSEFSLKKLMLARRLKSYLVRQSSKDRRVYQMDVVTKEQPFLVQTRIFICEDNHYYTTNRINGRLIIDRLAKYKRFADLTRDTAMVSDDRLIQPIHCIYSNELDECPELMISKDFKNIKKDVDDSGPRIVNHNHLKITDFGIGKDGEYNVNLGYINKTKVLIKEFHASEPPPRSNMIVKRYPLQLLSKWVHMENAHIVRSLGLAFANDLTISFVQEHFEAGPLDQYLIQNDLPVSKLLSCVGPLSRALLYLENSKFIHGLIRCHNIIVADDRSDSLQVKLADPVGELDMYVDSAFFPQTVRDKGPSYFSREFYHSEVDVWAFGTTVWQIFSRGQRPQPGSTESSLMHPATCPYNLWLIVQSCWHSNPSRQIQISSIVRDVYHVSINYHDESDNSTVITDTTYLDESPLFSKSETLVVNGQLSTTPSTDTLNQSSISELLGASILEPWPCRAGSFKNGRHDVNLQRSFRNRPKHIEFHQLKIVRELGEGLYGHVDLAELNCFYTKKLVAVKSINHKYTSDTILRDLKLEYDILVNLDHPNIVKVIGLVEKPNLMLVMEYLEFGSLSTYLQRDRDEPLPFTITRQFALEIARGMDYLASQCSIVHRDLAARNVLIGSDYHVKLCDFGLARFVDPSKNYYQLKNFRHLPLKWYAPETLDKWIFTHQTDVWSYGVLLWEIESGGEDPKYQCGPNDLLNLLQSGIRLEFPKYSSRIFADLADDCWNLEPDLRPSFAEIIDILETESSQFEPIDKDSRQVINYTQ